jgi:hypothetical protein
MEPFSPLHAKRKINRLMSFFGSQLSKRWFTEELFSGLLRLRGMECNSPSSYAEAFFCRKARAGVRRRPADRRAVTPQVILGGRLGGQGLALLNHRAIGTRPLLGCCNVGGRHPGYEVRSPLGRGDLQ